MNITYQLNISCSEFLANSSSAKNATSPSTSSPYIDLIFVKIGLPVVFLFGIVGNILNLTVLTRKQLKKSMDYMEKSAHISLTALAVSDMLFCVVALPYPFIDISKKKYTNEDFLLPLYYRMIHTPLFNLFIVCSTWLTVFMSVARFLAICYPLQSRIFISLKGTRIGILVVVLGSLALNLPRFANYRLDIKQCAPATPHCTCYELKKTDLFSTGNFNRNYRIVWAVLGALLPLVALVFCNICLIKALRNSIKVQHRYRANKPKQPTHKVTPTLIAIIVLFLVLVCPSEIIDNIALFHGSWRPVNWVSMISNFMMACNFAVNFVLYCIINKHFRETVRYIFCLRGCRKPGESSVTSTHNMTVMTDMDNTFDVTNL